MKSAGCADKEGKGGGRKVVGGRVDVKRMDLGGEQFQVLL